MAYHKLLGFQKEPFSTSPDPEFFYLTREHDMALTNILIELRLKRGLTVIFGDIGTGKTSLSRKLVQELKARGDMIFHMILNPVYADEKQYLNSLIRNYNVDSYFGVDNSQADIIELRDVFEKFLIKKTLEDKQTVILIIDEAQKLDYATLETLRVLLNFETNEYKLLQLVLLGQVELFPKIVDMTNFMDRISFKYTLNPLDYAEVKELICFRIRQAGYQTNMQLFLEEAIREVYQHSRGYPRQVIMLCRWALKNLILKNKAAVDAGLIRELIEEESRLGWSKKETLLQKSSF